MVPNITTQVTINKKGANDYCKIKEISSKYFHFQQELKWKNIFILFLFHALGLYGILTYPYAFNRKTLFSILWFFGYGGVGGFGVTGGAHRYWTHRSYKAKLPWKIILMCCFSASGQNTIYEWVRDHRVHHKYSETSSDPHNARRGFFFAHMGWLMMKKHPDVIEMGRKVDMSDIIADPVAQFHQRYFLILHLLFSHIIPIVVPMYLWDELWRNAVFMTGFGRYIALWNIAWLVNSAAHIWGYRPYDRRINPSENIFVSLSAMGEGWHNYHHTFPWDYRAAELSYCYPLNLTTFWIDMAAAIGWVYDRKETSDTLIENYISKYGDGSHYFYKTNKEQSKIK